MVEIIVFNWVTKGYDAVKDEIIDSTDSNTTGSRIARGILFVIFWAFIIGLIYLFIALTWFRNIKTGFIITGSLIMLSLLIELFHWIGIKI